MDGRNNPLMHSKLFTPLPFLLLLIVGLVTGCGPAAADVTPTPTKTPTRVVPTASHTPTPVPPTETPTPSPTDTLLPTPTATDTPVPPSDTATPEPPTETSAPTATPVPATDTPAPPTPTPLPTSTPKPQVDFVIGELRVLGLGENNGGIESGGLRNIYVTVTDAGGAPIDNAVILNTAPYPGRAVTGEKGSGKTEILMDKEEFRLTIESVNGAAVTSETSRTMSLINPVPSDIAGKLGDTCPTVDNCPLPPYKHFSYVITFRRTY